MLRIRIRYERKQKCSFRDHFTSAKKEDDSNTRKEFREGTCNDKRKAGSGFWEYFTPAEKKETTIIHAKNSDKVRAQTKVQF